MNSNERVLAALEHRRPDRPATSLRCTPEVWAALAAHFGVQTENDVLDALDIDLRRLYVLPFNGPQERSTVPFAGEGADFWGCRFHKAQNSFNTYFELDYHPLANAKTVADVEHYDWPSLDWWDYDAIARLIDETSRGGERAVMLFAGGAFETPWYIRGFERFLQDLYLHPEIAHAICRHVEEYYRERALRVLAAAGKNRIQIIGSGGDVGGQGGMLISPYVWRTHIKHYSGNLIRTFKQMGYKTFYHSCGSLAPVIPDLIDLGLDVLDPLQVTAAGMRPEELAPAFADRLTFHGAIDEVELLPHASPDEVYRETTRVIDILGCRGGYIVSPSHQVQGDTPVENVLALFQAARNYRWK